LWADCIDNIRPSTSHNPMGFHGLLQGYLHFFYSLVLRTVKYSTITLEVQRWRFVWKPSGNESSNS
jgi:hypothetical protein